MAVVRGEITERLVCGVRSLELEIWPLLCSKSAFLSEIVISAGSFIGTRGESNWAANSCTERILFSGFFFSSSTALDDEGVDSWFSRIFWEILADFISDDIRPPDGLLENFPANWLATGPFGFAGVLLECVTPAGDLVFKGDADLCGDPAVNVQDLAVSSSISFSCSFSNSNIKRDRDSVGVKPWDSYS